MSKVCAKCNGLLIYYLFGGWSHVDGLLGHPPEPMDEVTVDMRKIDDVLHRCSIVFRPRGKKKSKRR